MMACVRHARLVPLLRLPHSAGRGPHGAADAPQTDAAPYHHLPGGRRALREAPHMP
jgi:hypothetical protein